MEALTGVVTLDAASGRAKEAVARVDAALARQEPTPDLLADLSSITKTHQTVIGFALEPAARLLTSAREKLTRKKLHAIVANPLETMDAEQVTATVLLRDGRQFAAGPDLPKREFARWLLTVMEPTLRAAGQAVC